jgi:FAD/FMN-containing dehydrogenase/Fe-S oxidoreductase
MSFLRSISHLKRSLAGEVHTDTLRRFMLSTDGSIFKKLPAFVVYPKNTSDVLETVRFAASHSLSVHARGAGSGLCGACLGSGIVIDFTKFMNRLLHIDEKQKRFSCEPGYRFGELEVALKNRGLFFPPDPSSGEYASFGGMYATNASGAHSVKYGNVSDYIMDAEVVIGDGQIITLSEVFCTLPEALPKNLSALYRLYETNAAIIESAYPPIACNVAGYHLRRLVKNGRLDLSRLFSGAEGTLGIITRLTFRLLDRPAQDTLVVAYFDDRLSSARASQLILPLKPAGIEIMDKSLLRLAREYDPALREKIPDGIDNVLLIEFDGPDKTSCEALATQARELISTEGLTENAYTAVSDAEKASFWAVRKAAVPILYKLKGEKKILALVEDAAVPTARLTDYFKGLYEIFTRHGVDFVLYGHIAKGLLHSRPLLNLKKAEDVRLLKLLAEETFELVHSLGGVVSGEHGDGRLRSAFIKRQYPAIYDLFLQVKRLLDPGNLLNPDIITVHDPFQMEKDLRYGTSYRSGDLSPKHLRWPEGFVNEAERCHGCSKCTTVTTATRMCPVYKFTRDEAAAPKAKANLLRALMSGALSNQTLFETAFQLVMDRCANCGACHMECPSNVNIPKLAMEARAQYVKCFGPSAHARIVSHVEQAGRFAGNFSRTLQPVMAGETARKAGALLTGISPRRPFIEFSSRSLFDRIGIREGGGDIPVLYFAGCYAAYIKPKIGEALVKVLTRMGMSVYTPPQHCCGLPAMSKGMMGDARKRVRKNLDKWARLIGRVSHIVVTCSSCGYALMKDWADLIDAPYVRAMSEKVIHVSRLIDSYRDRLDILPRPETICYHQPCHLKIQPDPDSSLRLLSRIPGLTVENLNSHCCGMIGSWGLSADNFDLSMKIGAPLIDKLNASNAAMGITDCPTCRMQMAQFSRKPIWHPVEFLAECISMGSPVSSHSHCRQTPTRQAR